MSKRFTETKKWADPWFQDLDPTLKCVWAYVLDHCDNAGVWVVNTKLMGFQIGKAIAWDTVKAKFGKRLLEFAPGKVWIPKFIQFQYGALSEACKPHQKIISLLKFHTLWEAYTKGIDTLQEEEEDREEDKDRDLGDGGPGEEPDNIQATRDTLRSAVACELLNNPDFATAWDAFLKMRKDDLKKPATEEAQKRLLRKLEKQPIETAIEMLDESIMNSWQGVFPPKESHGRKSAGQESAAQRNGRRLQEELGKVTAGIGAAGGHEVLPLLPEADA